MRAWIVLVGALMIAGCAADFDPREKTAGYDAATGKAVLPYPCPDWSQNATVNFDNSLHSNYGCAVNNNLAVQLADPQDLVRGRGTGSADLQTSTRTLERYRAGEIPLPLTPVQAGTDQ